MKKFLAILFSVVVTLGAITVLGANVNDPYEFDGDVITNPVVIYNGSSRDTNRTDYSWSKLGFGRTEFKQ